MQSSLDLLRTQIQDAEPVLKRLDAEMEKIQFDPLVDASVNSANVKILQVIEQLLSPFGTNPVLGPLTESLKAQYLEGIQAQVDEARNAA